MNLEYSSEYARFGRAHGYDDWRAKNNFLDSPHLIAELGSLAFLSAFYRYMTPIFPQPSVHEVVVGHW